MLISRFPPYIGGTEIQCLRLSQQLAERGNSVKVLTEQPLNSTIQAAAATDGIDVMRFSTLGAAPFSSIIYAFKSLVYVLTHPDFDVLHAHMIATPAFIAILAGKLLDKPVVVKVAGGGKTGEVGSRTLVRGRLKLRLFKKAAPYVVCPSEETFQELRGLGLPEAGLNRIPNGVDTSHFSPALKADVPLIRNKLNLPLDRRIAIYAGRWAHGKRVDSLLAVWQAGLRFAGWQWDLLLVLAGALSEDQKVQLEKLRPHVHIRQNIEDCLPYYHSSDLAVLISEGEGLSNFLLEAMSCGLPTLTTEAAAISKLPEREAWGCVLDDGVSLIQDMADKLIRLQKDPDTLKQKGERARKIVQERYSLDYVTSLYESLYTRMIEAKRP